MTPEPKIGQIWNYEYHEPTLIDQGDSFVIVVTSLSKDQWVKFNYIDNWDADEMSYSVFQKYCQLVSG